MILSKIIGLCSVILFGFTIEETVTFESSSFTNIGIDRLKNKFKISPLHMYVLTQKDYIQFLRWELPVPDIEEFTFCLWLSSNNFTYPQSIFSYSKNEKDRLVRGWISGNGQSVHLEIGGIKVFEESVTLRENQWYHICQSWENRLGRFALWMDGRIMAQGYSDKTVNHVIPKSGDIVLGQEYTDFDKGLEEGIEGSIFGFNLLLKSAFEDESEETTASYTPSPLLSYGTRVVPRIPSKVFTNSDPESRILSSSSSSSSLLLDNFKDISHVIDNGIPLGQQLVKLSYVNCELGKGSPPIGGSLMLISWSRTPVRIFGGAILKNARNYCGYF